MGADRVPSYIRLLIWTEIFVELATGLQRQQAVCFMQSRARFGAFQLPGESNGEFGDLSVSMFANPGLPEKKEHASKKEDL